MTISLICCFPQKFQILSVSLFEFHHGLYWNSSTDLWTFHFDKYSKDYSRFKLHFYTLLVKLFYIYTMWRHVLWHTSFSVKRGHLNNQWYNLMRMMNDNCLELYVNSEDKDGWIHYWNGRVGHLTPVLLLRCEFNTV